MKTHQKIRYAVVGCGHIAQVAVMPAFRHAEQNSELRALVSGDPEKHSKLGRKYGVPVYSYDQYETLLRSGQIDAVYIALPNTMHREFAVRAAKAGVHILCEKPMATTERDAQQMIDAARSHQVKLMVAYRLHFEAANLAVIDLLRSGKLGDPRVFNSVFSLPVAKGNIRTKGDLGGGTLWDLGIYCINAARYLFRSEPTTVAAFSVGGTDERFRDIDEMTSCLLRFPDGRLASFTSSFAAADSGHFSVLGTKGTVQLTPAYDYVGDKEMIWTMDEKKKRRIFPARDHFAAELLYFSDAILKNRRIEPSGEEGLADIRIIRALYRAAKIGRPISLQPVRKVQRPSPHQKVTRPPVQKPELIHAHSSSGQD